MGFMGETKQMISNLRAIYLYKKRHSKERDIPIIARKCPHSVRILENTDQKVLRILTFFTQLIVHLFWMHCTGPENIFFLVGLFYPIFFMLSHQVN